MNTTDLLLSKLENLYSQAKTFTTRKNFFLSIIDYLDFVHKEKSLNFIFDLLKKQKDEDLKEIKEAENNALNELKNAFKKIKTFIEKNQIKNDGIFYELKDFESIDKGITILISGNKIEQMYRKLINALYYLMKSEGLKYKNFYQKFARFTDDFQNIEWTFSPNVYKYLDLFSKIGRTKQTKPWFVFEKLAVFYDYYFKLEDIQKQAYEKNDYFELLGIPLLKKDINTILTKENEETEFIKIKDYYYYLDKFHFFVKETLSKIKEERKPKWSYDSINAVFTANGKRANLRKESFRAKMLELITKNEKKYKKIWYWDEIAEKIEKLKDEEKLKNKIYETGRDINEIIASKTGITNFLIVKTQSIQINPLYLE